MIFDAVSRPDSGRNYLTSLLEFGVIKKSIKLSPLKNQCINCLLTKFYSKTNRFKIFILWDWDSWIYNLICWDFLEELFIDVLFVCNVSNQFGWSYQIFRITIRDFEAEFVFHRHDHFHHIQGAKSGIWIRNLGITIFKNKYFRESYLSWNGNSL